MNVGQRIQRRREELNMTQTELAKLMGYASKSAVSRAENSGDDIGTNRIIKFAEALKTTPAYLMGWDEEEKREVPTYVPGTVELIDLYSRVNEEQRQAVLNLLRSFVND